MAGSEPVVVFWQSAAKAAVAYRPSIEGQALTFRATVDGYVDVQTGSTWTFEGLAVSGAMEGRRLAAFPKAYVSFWFAWATFQVNTTVWVG